MFTSGNSRSFWWWICNVIYFISSLFFALSYNLHIIMAHIEVHGPINFYIPTDLCNHQPHQDIDCRLLYIPVQPLPSHRLSTTMGCLAYTWTSYKWNHTVHAYVSVFFCCTLCLQCMVFVVIFFIASVLIFIEVFYSMNNLQLPYTFYWWIFEFSTF